VAAWKQEKTKLLKKQKDGKPLDTTLDQVVWEWFKTDIQALLPPVREGDHHMTVDEIRSFLNNNCHWDDNYLWEQLLGVCDAKREEHEQAVPV